MHLHRPLYYIILLALATSCSKSSPERFIKHINGYWEIEKVITYEGIEKQYNYNQMIDFFETTNRSGIRKKVQPRFDGNYTTTTDNEKYTLIIEEDSLRIYYKTPHATWKETVISAKENQIILKNKSGNLYFYKPYKKMEL